MINSDVLTYELINDKEHRHSNKLAWVIGIVFGLVVLAILWSSMRKEQTTANNRATDFAFALSNRVGALEGNQTVIGTILDATTRNLNATMLRAEGAAVNVAAQGKVLDEVVEVLPRNARYYAQPGGCAALASAVNPKFRQVNEYTQCNSRLFEEQTCGNAGA